MYADTCMCVCVCVCVYICIEVGRDFPCYVAGTHAYNACFVALYHLLCPVS